MKSCLGSTFATHHWSRTASFLLSNLSVVFSPTDYNRRALPHPLPEGEVTLLYPEPLCGSTLQAGGLLCFWLCHQPVLHRHCQSVRRALAAAFPGSLRFGFLHDQLR